MHEQTCDAQCWSVPCSSTVGITSACRGTWALDDWDPQCINSQCVNLQGLLTQCLGRCSDKLDSEAIVEFVRALCAVAQEELDPAHAPRVYGLTKIVEISHFNMSRIRQGDLQVFYVVQLLVHRV